EGLSSVRNRLFGARKGGNVRLFCEGAGGDLVPHRVEHLGIWSDELQSRLATGAGEVGILRKKSVTRVNEGNTFLLRNADDAFDVEVGTDGSFFLAEAVGFIGLEAVAGKTIFLGVDGHG